MKNIVVLISGSGSNLQAIINACKSNEINGRVICVISNNPSAFGLERAKKFKIKTKIIDHNLYSKRDKFDDDLQFFLEELSPDLIVLAGFMRILGSKITNKFSDKMINLHPSLLPLYPGLNTHDQVLANKDSFHGISIHYVSPKLDGGPLIAQGVIKVNKNEEKNNLIDRIHNIEHILLPKIINQICLGNINLVKGRVIYKDLKSHKKGYIQKHYEI